MANIPPDALLFGLDGFQNQAQQQHPHGVHVVAPLAHAERETLSSTVSVPTPPPPPSASPSTPEGIDCYGDERQALGNMAKFFNTAKLSDIILKVGTSRFFGHKLVLVRSSDVFERMLSVDWSDPTKKELELFEEPACGEVFPRFLRYLYSCHINLNTDNTLPVLILADKYNVEDLRLVCINFACTYIIPKLQLKDVFHTWFQYATKGTCHQKLVASSVRALSEKMDDIMLSAEWDQEWVNLDKDQLIEILHSSDLMVKNEYELWKAVLKWIHSSSHPVRTLQQQALLKELLGHIRFPMFTPDQVCAIEGSSLAQQFPDVFQPYLLMAYKYHALPLVSRVCVKEFNSPCFLMRKYTDLRWDKRLVITNFSEIQKGTEVSLRFSTRASTFPAQTWEWELKVHPKGFSSTAEDFRVSLCSNLILDQPRPIEYWLSVVGRDKLIHSVSGKKNFSKTRYTMDTEMDKKISVVDLTSPNSCIVVDDCLILQIVIKPVD